MNLWIYKWLGPDKNVGTYLDENPDGDDGDDFELDDDAVVEDEVEDVEVDDELVEELVEVLESGDLGPDSVEEDEEDMGDRGTDGYALLDKRRSEMLPETVVSSMNKGGELGDVILLEVGAYL